MCTNLKRPFLREGPNSYELLFINQKIWKSILLRPIMNFIGFLSSLRILKQLQKVFFLHWFHKNLCDIMRAAFKKAALKRRKLEELGGIRRNYSSSRVTISKTSQRWKTLSSAFLRSSSKFLLLPTFRFKWPSMPRTVPRPPYYFCAH